VPLVLDVTSAASAAAAAERADEVTLLVNNAGASIGARFDDLEASRAQFESNFWSQLHITNAFARLLARNDEGGGAVLNVLSVLSWLGIADVYGATKAAFWSVTNAQRLLVAPSQVLAQHLGYTDAPMICTLTGPRNEPVDECLEAGVYEVLADEVSGRVKGGTVGSRRGALPRTVQLDTREAGRRTRRPCIVYQSSVLAKSGCIWRVGGSSSRSGFAEVSRRIARGAHAIHVDHEGRLWPSFAMSRRRSAGQGTCDPAGACPAQRGPPARTGQSYGTICQQRSVACRRMVSMAERSRRARSSIKSRCETPIPSLAGPNAGPQS
jgi:hypothetical protein